MLKQITSIALCGLTLLALSVPPARPALAAPALAPFVVNSTADEVDHIPGDGKCLSITNHCTLRAAVMEADLTTAPSATIIVPAGIFTLTIPFTGTDDASNGDLNLTSPPPATDPVITLLGAGAGSTIIDANQLDRVLSNASDRQATISGVTLRDGFVGGKDGGGLSNSGSLTVTHSLITANTTALNGGGATNHGVLTVIDSTISGNHAYSGGGVVNVAALTVIQSTISGNSVDTGGGGAFNAGNLTLIQSTLSGNGADNEHGGGLSNNGTVTLDRSTLSGNHADSGGAIENAPSGSVIVVDSTLSENYVTNNGGAIDSDGQVNLYSTTIVDNWADADRDGGSGGGVFNQGGGTFNLRNTLLAGNNLGNTPVWDDCTGALNAYGTDFVDVEGDTPSCTLNQPGGGNLYKLNSLSFLSGLRDNGGPTKTIALLAGSSAISSGAVTVDCIDQNSDPLATDQRGAARVVGAACDIGAFEFLPPVVYMPLLRR